MVYRKSGCPCLLSGVPVYSRATLFTLGRLGTREGCPYGRIGMVMNTLVLLPRVSGNPGYPSIVNLGHPLLNHPY